MSLQARSSWLAGGRASLALAAALCVLGALLPATADAVYEKIRVAYPEGGQPSDLFFHPDLELMGDDDGAYILLSRPELTEGLIARGFEVEVLVPDLEAYYAARQRGERDYGVWHTYDETVAEMDLLHSQFPHLTTAKSVIGTTGQGRTIWGMKISDNPGTQEAEPEVLFDGMIHAREIMTVEVILHYMRYLCENYGTDPVVTFLVDNRQIWFIPLLNVDGFVYNEQTSPNGGGMWRKNRRNNGSGCYGVDNNRNFTYQWTGSGSSPDPCSETYRGPSAGSEPENVAIMNFINAHNFVTWQSYHSVAGMVLFPWGYTTGHTQDDGLFRQIAGVMASAGGYSFGQPPELLYSVNGGSFDWGYGATTEHAKIFAFTTEVSGSDFWPQPSERDMLIAQNLNSNLYLCQIAGAYLALNAFAVTGGDGNGRLDPGESASIVATVGNPGVLVGATNVRIALVSDDPYVTVTDAQSNLGNIAAGGSANNNGDPFDVTVAAGCPAGRNANFRIVLEADGGLKITETRSLPVGEPPVLYTETFEGATAWAQDPTHTAPTGAFVRVDPVATNYQPGDDTTPSPGIYAWITGQNPGGADGTDDVDSGIAASRSGVIDLSGESHARLDLMYFFGQRDAGDDAGDGFRIDVSNDGGGSWVNLLQIGDVSYQATWRNFQVTLEDHLPLTAQMMLRVQAADPGGSGGTGDIIEGGLDDVRIFDMGDGNEPPPAPNRLSPADGAPGQPSQPTLVVANVVDPDGDAVTYSFRVYADPYLTQVVASADGIPAGAGGQTSWVVNPPLADGEFYWRAFASDPVLAGSFSTTGWFTVAGSGAVPEPGATAATLIVGPNPTVGGVVLRYQAPAAPWAQIQVFDSAGRRVRRIEAPRWSEGWQEVVWDGLDDAGLSLPAGVYHVRLAMPQETRSVRVIRIR